MISLVRKQLPEQNSPRGFVLIRTNPGWARSIASWCITRNSFFFFWVPHHQTNPLWFAPRGFHYFLDTTRRHGNLNFPKANKSTMARSGKIFRTPPNFHRHLPLQRGTSAFFLLTMAFGVSFQPLRTKPRITTLVLFPRYSPWFAPIPPWARVLRSNCQKPSPWYAISL